MRLLNAPGNVALRIGITAIMALLCIGVSKIVVYTLVKIWTFAGAERLGNSYHKLKARSVFFNNVLIHLRILLRSYRSSLAIDYGILTGSLVFYLGYFRNREI